MTWQAILKLDFKDTIFNTDRELIEFKRELRNIKEDEEERYQKIKHKPEDDSYAKRRRKANIEKKRLFMTIEHIEDYLNEHLRQYPVLNEQQKLGVIDWFTKESLMNALERYKTRYIEKLADFMYDKYGATIPTSILNELGIDGTFNKSHFKNTIFGRHLALFKKRINRLTGSAFGPPINKEYRRQAADMAFSMLDEAVASNDKERQEEILNDLYYGEAGKKIKELYDKSGKETVFKHFKSKLRSFVAEQFPRAKNDTVNEVISIDGIFDKSVKIKREINR